MNIRILISCIILMLLSLSNANSLLNEIIDSPPSCGQMASSDFKDEGFTNAGANPWVALIGYENLELEKKFYGCTGTLLNSRYVLSTAACLSDAHALQVSYFLTHVRLGEHNIHEDPDCVMAGNNPCLFRTRSIDVGIEQTVHHPHYNSDGFQSYNVGLIKLEQAVDFEFFDGFITPICLPPLGLDPKTLLQDKYGKVVGWDFGSGHPNDTLMKEFLLLADDEDCEMWYAGFIREKQICMKSENVRRRCTGDSGSPLTVEGPEGVIMIGMLSHGPMPCGFSTSPSVFTSVSYYRDWIDSNMNF